jgi:hypothetical protein
MLSIDVFHFSQMYLPYRMCQQMRWDPWNLELTELVYSREFYIQFARSILHHASSLQNLAMGGTRTACLLLSFQLSLLLSKVQ